MSDLDRFRQEWREEVRERASHRAEGRRRQRNEFQHLSSVAQSNPTVVVHNENAFKAERPKDIYINETLSELDLLALDDFEKAVDREHVGKLGDAVKYYRDAFRKNEQVDKLFREKYYSKKGHQSNKTIDHLSKDMSELSVDSGAENEDEKSLILELPLEILEHIVLCLAVEEFHSFVESAYTCKRFWEIFSKSQSIWKSLCLKEYPYQHYTEDAIEKDFKGALEQSIIVETLYKSNWKTMYGERPRIRFNGVYVSTCNYMRSGMGETWSTPIHMVTYYRYYRFYRDGTCISLLTVAEPVDVLPVFSRQTMEGSHPIIHTRDDGTTLTRPKGILYGTWQLTSNTGDVLIETEGSVDRYTFYLHLQIRSSGKHHHNKLKWKRYWSFNKLSLSEGVSTCSFVVIFRLSN
jgi:F-box protein 9